ncbi:hypothetical protein [Paenibacillus sp. CF384]|uniref:hypothetical protein n=1 Tax=Paenibacillus sp. CF384 TaxID=1884382 RepID=UPI000899CCF2|nr:hypothetical protein [Paenibacillus sp. CF384]SDX31720.1 hypothetical protein SAMN05518855_101218 [Paenibacillus sp. CF384]
MRNIPNALKFAVRYGSRMMKISFILCLAGVYLTVYNIPGNPEGVALSAALLFFGCVLSYVSLVRANRKINLLESGHQAVGTFQEWKNSFITYNNGTLVFLCYSYVDMRRKKQEARTLSTSADGLERTNVFYDEEDSTILEYLPGKPSINSQNEFEVGSRIPTLLFYAAVFLVSLAATATSHLD